MKALVFHDIGDIRLDDAPDPRIENDQDAIVRLTAASICGTDLHMVRGTMSGMKPGTILGHEGVGIVEEVGRQVRNFRKGDRVVVCSTIACGYCSYCRAGLYSQCDNANPGGRDAGTAFFGGPESTGAFNGMQAQYVRVPFANVGMVRIPECLSDDQAILASDVLPTGYFGVRLAGLQEGGTIAVFGCGPVGLSSVLSARFLGAGRILAVDCREDRLELARAFGAEAVDFGRENPVEAMKGLTGGGGVECVVDAVGMDAEPAGKEDEKPDQVEKLAPVRHPKGDLWKPGTAPLQVLEWGVEAAAKAGTLAVIGVYSATVDEFPFGKAMGKNLAIRMGNCNHRRYTPYLMDLMVAGSLDPTPMLTRSLPFARVLEAYEAFDRREPGWTKVKLEMR